MKLFTKLKIAKYIELDINMYASLLRKGKIINGILIDDDCVAIRKNIVNGIRNDEMEKLKDILLNKKISELNWEDWSLLTQIYDYITNEDMTSRYELINIKEENKNIKEENKNIKEENKNIKEENKNIKEMNIFPYTVFGSIVDDIIDSLGECKDTEGCVKFSWIMGSYDLIFKNTLVELKTVKTITNTHRQQALIYNSCLNEPKEYVYIINLMDGKVEEITSPQHPTLWKYIIDVYGTIRNHIDIVTCRKNKYLNLKRKLPIIPTNLYMADTEYDSEFINYKSK